MRPRCHIRLAHLTIVALCAVGSAGAQPGRLPEIIASPANAVPSCATPERLIQVRQNRLLSMGDRDNDTYIDRQSVTDEVAYARRLSAKFNWAQLDVTRRSIEETAAAVLKLFADRQRHRLSDE